MERAATAPPPELGTVQYLGYAAGGAANNLAFSMPVARWIQERFARLSGED